MVCEKRSVGSRVHAKATAVLCVAECKRLYGSLWKTKNISGTVLEVVKDRSSGRVKTSFRVKWEYGGNKVKEKQINTRSVKAGEQPASTRGGSEGTETPQLDREEATVTSQDQQLRSFLGGEEQRGVCLEEAEEVSQTFGGGHDLSQKTAADTVVQGMEWRKGHVPFPLNGYVPRRQWMVQCPGGELVVEGQDDSDRCPLDYFLTMFPMEHMVNMWR